jgi:hypothetical protein
MAVGPSALPPTDSDAHWAPNTPLPRYSPDPVPVHALRSAGAVVRLRCIQKAAPKQGW